MYDYREAMTENVKEWIKQNIDLTEWTEDREGLEQQLNDDLWTEDSITGNAIKNVVRQFDDCICLTAASCPGKYGTHFRLISNDPSKT